MHGFIWGACVVLFQGVCMVLFGGHVHGFIRGHAWFYPGGMHGFIRWGVHGFSSFFGYNEIRSMSGRYASYWNAFLFGYLYVSSSYLWYHYSYSEEFTLSGQSPTKQCTTT